MEKSKNKILSFMLAICIVLCSIISICTFNWHNVFAEQNYSITDYTDDDMLLNSKHNIVDYANSTYYEKNGYMVVDLADQYSNNGLYSSTVKYTEDTDRIKKLHANGDDPIVQIVPKELFKTANDGIVEIGKEYGFFIKTDEVVDGVYVSTISVFDITNKVKDEEVKDSAIFSLKHLF